MPEVKRALISVSDKRGIEEFARGLHRLGVEILSTGGTAKRIEQLGIPVKEVSSYTGFPEMLDGRVKTLHPKIHAGLLALRGNTEHMKQLEEHAIGLIDMVVVNLYPFQKVIQREDVKLEEAIENIDIGGPSMLRSGAKNYRDVAVVCNPDRYRDILKELTERDGRLSEETTSSLAVEVFQHTSIYDAAISGFLKERSAAKPEKFPEVLQLQFKKVQDLRYGENSHQMAAFYKEPQVWGPSVSSARQLHGKELSFNNILDLDAALSLVRDFQEPAASVIKHTNPCGAACADTLAQAYRDALDCDRVSAFGSVVGLNREVDLEAATEVASADFVECLIAPGYQKEALELLKKKKNLRIMEVGPLTVRSSEAATGSLGEFDLKRVAGGLLVQDRDLQYIGLKDLKVVTKARPTDEQLQSLLFGWKIVKYVKSNAIVLCKKTKAVGIGAGQMSRVDSCIIAARKAGSRAKGSCLASDAFFPKDDAIVAAKEAGVEAIIQPGGSIRDQEVIEAADTAGIAMVFTGMRHFRH